jgi:hypothetical protein
LMQNFSIGSSTKNGFFAIEDMNGPNPTSWCKIPQLGLQQKLFFFLANLRHEWAKHVVKQKCGWQVWITYERLVASFFNSISYLLVTAQCARS